MKTRFSLKYFVSYCGLQTIAIHILPNISQSKGNQTMKFGQLIKYKKRNYAEIEIGRLIPDLFLVFEKAYN